MKWPGSIFETGKTILNLLKWEKSLDNEVIPASFCWTRSPLPQHKLSPACDIPDTGLSFSEASVLHLTASPGSPLQTGVLPRRWTWPPLLQFKRRYPFVWLLCVSWLVNTYCIKCMMAVVASRTFKKLYFYYETIINPALNHHFFALTFQFQTISFQIVNMQLHEQCN